MPQSLKLVEHIRIAGRIICLTGLRIGGTKDDIEIGGMDNPIIRHPVTREPYIPGSSLKGKLRSMLEYRYCSNWIERRGEPCGCKQSDCRVCVLFGPHKQPQHDLGPTRLLVRDAHLKKTNATDDPDHYIEVKSETAINRQTGVAFSGSLRQNERVVEGTEFEFEISMRIFGDDDKEKFKHTVREGLDLIEDEYLGASGSRGYGKVKFVFEEPAEWREQA